MTERVKSLSVSDPSMGDTLSMALTPAEPAPTAKNVATNIVFFIESSKKQITRFGRARWLLSKMRATREARKVPVKPGYSRHFGGVHGTHTNATQKRPPDIRLVLRISKTRRHHERWPSRS